MNDIAASLETVSILRSERSRRLPEPEAAAPVPPHPKHFSASALNTFAECERKWFYRYLCNAVADPGSSAGTYGTAMHAALEQLHIKYPRPGEQSRTELQTELLEQLDHAFVKHAPDFSSRLEAELAHRRARRTAERYLDWLIARNAESPIEVVGNEVPANLSFDGFPFLGFIDRIDREETGGISVIDYKTGNISESAAEYREKIAAYREFQLPFYYWSRTLLGDRVTRLALIPLKDSALTVLPVELEVVRGPVAAAPQGTKRGRIGTDELERARKRINAICASLAQQTKEKFAVTTDTSACTYCAYRTSCRERPSISEDPFGR